MTAQRSAVDPAALRVAQEGSVYVGEARKPLAELNIRWWRQQIGFVGQEPVLFNTSVRNNVLYGVEGDVDEEYIKKCEKMCNLKFLYTPL